MSLFSSSLVDSGALNKDDGAQGMCPQCEVSRKQSKLGASARFRGRWRGGRFAQPSDLGGISSKRMKHDDWD